MLKFCGVVAPSGSVEPPAAISFLADWGIGHGLDAILFAAPSYPATVAGNFRNMSVNLPFAGVPPSSIGALVIFELLLNGAPVPGFVITYGPGEGGVKSISPGPIPFLIGQTIDMRITNFGSGVPPPFIDASATVGVE